MAFDLRSSNARKTFRGSVGTLSEMNVVPLIDVVLVLLIVFMLTAHAMESGMEIHVPEVKRTESATEDLPVVNLSRTGATMLGETALNINLIPAEIHRKFKNSTAVYVRADSHVTYDNLAQVINALSGAKFTINLVMTPIDSQRN